MKKRTTFLALALLGSFTALHGQAATRVWMGGTSVDWSTPGNWDTGVPLAGDDVIIANAGADPVLSADTPDLGSLTITNKTLLFTNWTTTLKATNVFIRNAGKLTAAGPFSSLQMSNRVYVVCTNLTIDPGGAIDADGKGYKPENGPGKGTETGEDWSPGAGHGGKGGPAGSPAGSPGNYTVAGPANDSLTDPVIPGSGGTSFSTYSGGFGGGVIRLEVADTLLINGTLTANAVGFTPGNYNPGYASGGGAGGTVYLACGTFGGGTGGVIRAQGSNGDATGGSNQGSGGGGGGRIAVRYNNVAAEHNVRFCTSPGSGWRSSTWDYTWHLSPEMGTVYLTDERLLSPVLANEQFRDVRLYLGVNQWAVDSLVVSNCGVTFAQEGFTLVVTNGLRVDQNAAFGFGAFNGGTNPAVLHVGQDLVLTNGGRLYAYGGSTNSAGTNYGTRISVTGTLNVASSSWIFPFANQTNGGAVLFEVGALSIFTNSGFNADAKGFGPDLGPAKGKTNVGYESGGGHGGKGGTGFDWGADGTAGGDPYGSISAPITAGSGGGSWPAGLWHAGPGGGAIWINAAGSARIDGTLTANGGETRYASGAGAGGSVFIACTSLGGSGLLSAQGSSAPQNGYQGGGGGGGGRVALQYAALDGTPGLRISTRPGVGHLYATPADTRAALMGSVYLSDSNLLTSTMTDLGGWLTVPGFSEWSINALSLSNAMVGFAEGFHLTVTGDVTVQGTNGCLAMGTNSILACGGNLTVTNNGQLRIYSGPTNGAPGDFGALVSVTGDVVIAANSWIYPYSHPTNGGAPLFRMNQLRVASGGGFCADAAGYGEDTGPGRAIRVNNWCGGGAHGGRGGDAQGTGLGSTNTYGLTNAPIASGSGGGSYKTQPGTRGGCGGGVVRIESVSAVTLDGTISANGGDVEYAGGGGSGGSIFISAASFAGGASGLLTARGENTTGYSSLGSGGGGGGRIAVGLGLSPTERNNLLAGLEVPGLSYYLDHAPFAGTLTVTSGVGYVNAPAAGGAAMGSRIFVSSSRTLSIVGEPANYDSPTPNGYGTHSTIPTDAWVTNSVSSPVDQANGARHTGIGWQVDVAGGGVATNGTNAVAVFQLTNNVTLTWKWTNQFEVAATSDSHGSVNSGTVDGWYNEGTEVTGIYATASGGYAFYQWSGDVPGGHEADNPLTVTMSQKRYVTANFVSNTGQTNVWTGSNVWESVTNWSLGAMPSTLDEVIVATGTVYLTQPRQVVALTVSNGGTMIFTNWNTSLTASNVIVRSGGVITLPPAFTNLQMSNRVYIVCTNFTLDAGGLIDADGKGYGRDTGPGLGGGYAGDWQPGSGHGGWGGNCQGMIYNVTGAGPVYDSLTAPAAPGSGGLSCAPASGYLGGSGGGAVRLIVGGLLTVNGTISANGISLPGGVYNPGYASGGGSGGSIWLTCGTFGGSTSGLIRAQGGNGDFVSLTSGSGAGGGGRIAACYNNLAAEHAARFQASAGAVSWRSNDWDSTWVHAAQHGTLYLPDTGLLSPVLNNGLFRDVRVFFPTNAWSVDSLTLDNCGLIFGDAGFRLTVTNGLLLDHATLGVGAVNGSNTVAISVGQDLVLTNCSRIYLYSGMSNNVSDFGARLDVTGNMVIGSNSWIFPYAHQTNGGAVKLDAASLAILAGSGINADGKGFASDQGPGKGEPQPVNAWSGGGGFGGKGGQGAFGIAGATYASPSNTLLPGSGGGSYISTAPRERGGGGGGAIRIDVAGGVTVDGTITANGAVGNFAAAGGSGGSIMIHCGSFGGAAGGLFSAQGGNGDMRNPGEGGGGGGGGRIAVNYTSLAGQPAIRFTALPGTGYLFATPGDPRAAQLGTLWFPDTQLVTTNQNTLSGYVMAPGFTSWAPGALTVSNAAFGLVDGFQMMVAGAVRVMGTNGMLVLGTNSLLACGGDMTIDTGAQVWVYSAPTNGGPDAYGALVNVGGKLRVNASSWIYPYADATNGGAPLFKANRLLVESGGGFKADGAGYMDNTGAGQGTGSVNGYPGGAGYGGRGGDGTQAGGGMAYGSSNAPIAAGSGGGTYIYGTPQLLYYRGGYGGGVVRIEVAADAVMDGTLSATGATARMYAAGGSGGSILLVAGTTVDAGYDSVFRVQGGNGYVSGPSAGGGGAGGRIAIWYKVPENERQRIMAGNMARVVVTSSYSRVLGTLMVSGGSGYQAGSNGTVVFLTVTPNPGTIMTLW